MDNPNDLIKFGSPAKIEPTYIHHDPDLHEDGVNKLENKKEDEHAPISRIQSLSDQLTVLRKKKEVLSAQRKVFDTLKCPCCWKFVGIYFEQCVNSHTVCSKCRLQIPNCPICRAKFTGRPVVLSAIVQYLIQIFRGLSSGDKAVDAFLKLPELTPSSPETRHNATTAETAEAELDEIKTEATGLNVTLVTKSVEVFLQQKSSMFVQPRQEHILFD